MLGSPALERDGQRVAGAGAQKLPLALLALLGVAGETGTSRDKLLAYLWPEVEPEKAGHRLRQVLHALRRELDAEQLFLGTSDVRLNLEIVEPDTVAFTAALARGDLEEAVSLYGGPFLDGFYLTRAGEFERWVEVQRNDWARRAGAALESLAEEAIRRGDPVGAAAWWERLSRLDPLDSRVAVRLMETLTAAGSRAEALRFARRHEALLREEFDAAPDAAVAALAERIRRRPVPAGPSPGAPRGAGGVVPGVAAAGASGRTESGAAASTAPRAAPSTIPALGTSAPRRWRSLPTPPTPLVGRRRPLARLKELLLEPGPRLVTLTGPGGTGKTRLALEAALQLAEAFGDGVCFVDLATLRDPERVAPAIARALGVPETAGQPVIESLKAALDGRRMLLVLDNFEQVVEGAPAAALLLEACPDLAVLATSRELLRLRGEHVFPVPALALPAETAAPAPEELARYGAVRLFVERARAVRADFRLTRENASAVAGICARLEGLPLSIELAAARIELLSPQALLEHLERPLELLTGGARDLPPRQQTLRSALAWSYELLDEGERSLFERLSAFVGGCTLDAAQAVSAAGGGAGIDVLDGASSLIGKSLLRRSSPAASTTPDEEPRLEMLETIRQFGVERLAASGQERAARDAHAAFFLALAEAGAVALAAGDRAPWLRRLEAEHDNLRAALDWTAGDGHDPATELRLAGALGRFWSFHSHLTEGRARLDGALRRAVSLGPTAERAKALAGAGGLATVQGD
jgi:predicted ATPase/DNA-binding SARP family transcriptional activator